MPILLIRKKKWMLLMQNLNFNLLQQKSVYSFLKPTDLSVTNKGCVKWEEGMKLKSGKRRLEVGRGSY